MINRYTRGRRISKRLVFGGGYPKFHLIPRAYRWGENISFLWLATELVWLGKKETEP